MISKLLAWFKSGDTATRQVHKNKTTPRKKIASTRIGELGEHKINIQLDQLPRECKYLSDLLILNRKSRSGYSQIDHLVISPYGLFVIETKNYNGEIKGKRSDKYWSVSQRLKCTILSCKTMGTLKPLKHKFPNLEA